MTKVVFFWNLPPGMTPETFEDHYLNVHIPIASRIPGLRRYVIGKGLAISPEEGPRYYRTAELHFDNREALDKALASPENLASAEDFGPYGVDNVMMIFEEEEVDLQRQRS
ncbi:MAG: EthD family reductase [Chloroflexi bacterium]|nr:EthD family reductase [Chloroflexota bacterium]